MSERIFIAGCGRSGTTLLLRLMRSIEGAKVVLKESHFDHFCEVETDKSIVVIKRKARSHKDLHELPPDIKLVYAIRHPFDVLTSFHGSQKDRGSFYITQDRWLSEFMALKRLLACQPDRDVFYVKYEHIVGGPDDLQADLMAALSVKCTTKFSAMEKIRSGSVEKWRRNEEYKRYLYDMPDEFRAHVVEFCAFFDYELPPDYADGWAS